MGWPYSYFAGESIDRAIIVYRVLVFLIRVDEPFILDKVINNCSIILYSVGGKMPSNKLVFFHIDSESIGIVIGGNSSLLQVGLDSMSILNGFLRYCIS